MQNNEYFLGHNLIMFTFEGETTHLLHFLPLFTQFNSYLPHIFIKITSFLLPIWSTIDYEASLLSLPLPRGGNLWPETIYHPETRSRCPLSSCPLSSVLRGESGGRGGDRSPLLGQAGADGRHLLIPADLNIQIRDKLFIHWNLSGETGLAWPRWGELSFIHIQEYVGVLKFWADQGEAVVTTYTETLIEFQKNIQIDNRYKSEIAT